MSHAKSSSILAVSLPSWLLSLALGVVSPAFAAPPTESGGREDPKWDYPADNVRAALDDEFRQAADKQRDADTGVEALLRATGVRRGMRVADLRAGDGYLASLLALATEPLGKVWANNDPASLDDSTAAAWKSRLEDPESADIARLDLPLTAPLPPYAVDLDLVISNGAYHDAVARGLDRRATFEAVAAALAPGGRLVVVEATAANDSSASDAAALCRARSADVAGDAAAAGLLAVPGAASLAVAADDKKTSACGRDGASVDRFVSIFEKAASAATD